MKPFLIYPWWFPITWNQMLILRYRIFFNRPRWLRFRMSWIWNQVSYSCKFRPVCWWCIIFLKFPGLAPCSYSSDEGSTTRKMKRLLREPRGDHESVTNSSGGGNKKCKKISATALNDTNEHIEDIRRFARAFKMKRLSLGLTQTQIGRALTAGDGPAYSQSAICR